MGLEALLMERIELGHGGDTLTGSFDVSKASFLPSAVCKRDLGHHSICLIHRIMQDWGAEVLSTMTHRDLSQKANGSAESKNRKRGGGRKGRGHEYKRAEKECFPYGLVGRGLVTQE